MSRVGTGATVTFGTSSYAPQIETITIDGIERPVVDTTHLGTANFKTFIPGDLVDPGEITLEIKTNPDTEPPISGAPETITIEFPSALATGAQYSGSGFVTSDSVTNPLEDNITRSVTVKCTGTWTWSDESA